MCKFAGIPSLHCKQLAALPFATDKEPVLFPFVTVQITTLAVAGIAAFDFVTEVATAELHLGF